MAAAPGNSLASPNAGTSPIYYMEVIFVEIERLAEEVEKNSPELQYKSCLRPRPTDSFALMHHVVHTAQLMAAILRPLGDEGGETANSALVKAMHFLVTVEHPYPTGSRYGYFMDDIFAKTERLAEGIRKAANELHQQRRLRLNPRDYSTKILNVVHTAQFMAAVLQPLGDRGGETAIQAHQKAIAFLATAQYDPFSESDHSGAILRAMYN